MNLVFVTIQSNRFCCNSNVKKGYPVIFKWIKGLFSLEANSSANVGFCKKQENSIISN